MYLKYIMLLVIWHRVAPAIEIKFGIPSIFGVDLIFLFGVFHSLI